MILISSVMTGNTTASAKLIFNRVEQHAYSNGSPAWQEQTSVCATAVKRGTLLEWKHSSKTVAANKIK